MNKISNVSLLCLHVQSQLCVTDELHSLFDHSLALYELCFEYETKE